MNYADESLANNEWFESEYGECDWCDTAVNDGHGLTAPVGSYPAGASPYGALDMAGNVWEWVADWYDEDYYERSPRENPRGPESGEYRVLRGGSWYFNSGNVRSSYRGYGDPDSRNDLSGFRCALPE